MLKLRVALTMVFELLLSIPICFGLLWFVYGIPVQINSGVMGRNFALHQTLRLAGYSGLLLAMGILVGSVAYIARGLTWLKAAGLTAGSVALLMSGYLYWNFTFYEFPGTNFFSEWNWLSYLLIFMPSAVVSSAAGVFGVHIAARSRDKL
jgi:hypothetical protein